MPNRARNITEQSRLSRKEAPARGRGSPAAAEAGLAAVLISGERFFLDAPRRRD